MYIHPQTGAAWVRRDIDAGVVTASALWTPASGNKIMITDIIVSTLSATTITLFFDTDNTDNRIFKGYFAANQGVALNFSGLILGPKDGVIKVTNTAATASIGVIGVEVS